jgi:hypothetical protein
LPGIYTPSGEGALRQGEIIAGLTQSRIKLDTIGSDTIGVEVEVHPIAIILSQDCDLEQDWKTRQLMRSPEPNAAWRQLPSILFAQIYTAAELRGLVPPGGELWKRIKQNKDERYQFLEKSPAEEDALNEGLEELGIDFKRYFTLPTDEAYQQIQQSAQRRCRLVSPYLEHLSTRFCYYQFRVALPQDHQSI